MQITSPLVDQWPQLRSLLPSGFDLEATARARGAFTRARGVKDAETLLRLALGYGACGMSLRECCAWAETAKFASLSDPALLKRLAKAADWLGDLVTALLADQGPIAGGRWAGYRVRAIDATSICAPGADRTTWRLHAGYDLATGQMDQLELTDGRGAETLTRFSHQAGDIAIADRGYARPRDLRPVVAAGADFIVRIGWNSLRLRTADGSVFDLFAALAKLGKKQGDVAISIDEGNAAADQPLRLRLVIRRKSLKEAKAAQKKLLKEAKKRGKKPDRRSLEAAKYILLLTSLPVAVFATADVLDLYRLRWQIELAFKRFKSLAGLDALPAKNPDLARTWIYARLIAALLAERTAGELPDSPPSAQDSAGRKPIAMALRQDHPRKHSRRHPRTAPLAKNPQRLDPHPAFPL
jgi:heme-degrading monooxygenase HmoA